MKRADLAKNLADAATARERKALLAANRGLADRGLADQIRKLCYDSWTSDPARARQAALAMRALAGVNDDEYISGCNTWVDGIAEITRGRFEKAVESLSAAQATLAHLGRETDSAQAAVALLIALAMLGRYDEAVSVGHVALEKFERVGDHLAAGKIEMNLSNIVSRRSQHHAAEKYCLSARHNFIRARTKSWQAMAENGLANTYAELNDFVRAKRYFQSALDIASSEKMTVTVAEIESSLGNLAMLQGEYADALRYLELSRQKYADLGMPHQSAIADLESAEIYSFLNLSAEADDAYRRVTPIFSRLKMRAEEGRSRLGHGRVSIMLDEVKTARSELRRALDLFKKERNASSEVEVLLSLIDAHLSSGQARLALGDIERARELIPADENSRHTIDLHLASGRACISDDPSGNADDDFLAALALAITHQQPDRAQAALCELGRSAAARGDLSSAKRFFMRAIRHIESLRYSLGAEEFSMAFFSSRIEPFHALSRILIAEGKFAKAFEMVESGRSRSLLDSFERRSSAAKIPQALRSTLAQTRSELNANYQRLDRAASEDKKPILAEITRSEAALKETLLQIESLTQAARGKQSNTGIDITAIKAALGTKNTLIEFVEDSGSISAFVVSASSIRFFPDLTTTADVRALVEQLHFQFGALRYGSEHLSRFAGQMKERADRCLAAMYDALIRPVAGHIRGERLIVVPAGSLFYVPFAALHDGNGYLLEKYETVTAPSASVWEHLQRKPRRRMKRPLLVGYADERIPLVEHEIKTLKKIMPHAISLTGHKASFSEVARRVSEHDLIHLACHGEFRADNPMFSSLHLADGWITVRDICSYRIKAELVTLSACETGVNEIFAGDEILGLARGFITAGASSLVVSLWAVNDTAAKGLMTDFYNSLQRDRSASASLREAQLSFVRRGEHPYLWAPFTYIGR